MKSGQTKGDFQMTLLNQTVGIDEEVYEKIEEIKTSSNRTYYEK